MVASSNGPLLDGPLRVEMVQEQHLFMETHNDTTTN
jgi:hypothetical protein